MKRIFLLTILASFLYGENIDAQKYKSTADIPLVDTVNGDIYWCGYSVKMITNDADLIFEGKVLSDSIFTHPIFGMKFMAHKILVLKQFKGVFKSDTIIIANMTGKNNSDVQNNGTFSYIRINDEAVFIVASSTKKRDGFDDPNLYFIIYGDQCGFKKVCDKKDVVKEVYEPIEKATGQKYIDVHPNVCATQQKK